MHSMWNVDLHRTACPPSLPDCFANYLHTRASCTEYPDGQTPGEQYGVPYAFHPGGRQSEALLVGPSCVHLQSIGCVPETHREPGVVSNTVLERQEGEGVKVVVRVGITVALAVGLVLDILNFNSYPEEWNEKQSVL